MGVVGAKSGGVAYSASCVIPWQKRTVEGSGIQQGGIVRRKKQKGGGGLMYYMKRTARMATGTRRKQKGGNWFERNMFGIKRPKGRGKKKYIVTALQCTRNRKVVICLVLRVIIKVNPRKSRSKWTIGQLKICN